MNDSIILAIQSTYQDSSIALLKNKKILDEIKIANNGSSKMLIPEIKNILEKNSLSLKDLSFICVDKGPGAFTSLRVGVVTANGLAFSSELKIAAVSSLETLIEKIQKTLNINSGLIFSALNAYSDELYVSCKNIKNKIYEIENSLFKKSEFLHFLKEACKKEKIIISTNSPELESELENLKNTQVIKEKNLKTVFAKDIGITALEKLEKSEIKLKKEISPLYIKENMKSAFLAKKF